MPFWLKLLKLPKLQDLISGVLLQSMASIWLIENGGNYPQNSRKKPQNSRKNRQTPANPEKS